MVQQCVSTAIRCCIAREEQVLCPAGCRLEFFCPDEKYQHQLRHYQLREQGLPGSRCFCSVSAGWKELKGSP